MGLDSGNDFTGGTSYNYVFFMSGGGNTYTATAAGSVSDVFEFGGSDTITPTNGLVQTYSYG